jgi:hypothetical protein
VETSHFDPNELERMRLRAEAARKTAGVSRKSAGQLPAAFLPVASNRD